MDKIKQYQTLNRRLTEMLEDTLTAIADNLYNDYYDKQTAKNLAKVAQSIANTIDDNNTAITFEYRKER